MSCVLEDVRVLSRFVVSAYFTVETQLLAQQDITTNLIVTCLIEITAFEV